MLLSPVNSGKEFLKMKILLIFSIALVGGTSDLLMAQQPKASDFDEGFGDILLPEVVVVPKNSTFSVRLRQVKNDEFIVEPDSITPINSSVTTYDPNKGLLHLPTITIKDETYKNVQLELVKPSTNLFHFRIVSMEKEINKDILKNVQATLETQPVRMSGDCADDSAIWVHPNNPAESTIIGTQKIGKQDLGGLAIYDLAGKEIQYLHDGNMNNVDLRYGFPLGDENVAIVAASNRSHNSIAIYKVNPVSRQLEDVAARTLSVGIDKIYGLCMYHSTSFGKYYVFVNNKRGDIEQREILANDSGLVEANFVRRLKVNSQVEGCVADDVLGHFYLGEEKVGIWKFKAEPDGGNEGYLIDKIERNGGNITPEVEGLTLFYMSETEGYLIASNQGGDSFTVYNRALNNKYLGRFRIVTNNELNIDAVSFTDGIDVINMPLNEAFPYGVFVAQDQENTKPSENQNFKLVPWENIADALGLNKESSYNPRN
jgi:3-phytase